MGDHNNEIIKNVLDKLLEIPIKGRKNIYLILNSKE